MAVEQEPYHPIIDKPWNYDIVELRYHIEPNIRESFIDLHLQRGSILRRLRFIGPRNLQIEAGFPCPTRGLCILDVRKRQCEGVCVAVADFEGNHGSITFLAQQVVDIDTLETH